MSALLLAATVAVVAATARTLLRSASVRRRSRREQQQAVEVLRALVAELGAGSAPPAALRTVVSDVAPRDRSLVDAAAAVDEPTAGRRLRRAGRPGLAPLTAAWQLSAATGAPLADVLARQASAATRAVEDAREVQTILAGPRTTAALLAGLPALGMLLAASTGARPLAFLLQTPAGRWCLLLGLSLDCAGLLWIDRLAR